MKPIPISNSLRILAACAVAAAFAPRAAEAYCFLNSNYWDISGSNIINVYVVTSGSNSVSDQPFATADTIHHVRQAIDTWNRAPGVAFEFAYAGEVSSKTHGADGVTVFSYASNQCAGCGGVMCTDHDNPPTTDVSIGVKGSNCSVSGWTTDPDGSSLDYVGALVHEFGHAVGLEHADAPTEYDCHGGTWDTNHRGVMTSGMGTTAKQGGFRNIQLDDFRGITSMDATGPEYGLRLRTLRYVESTNGTTWGGENTRSGWYTMSPPGASSARSTSGEHQSVGLVEDDLLARVGTGGWSDWNSYGAGAIVEDDSDGETIDRVASAMGHYVSGGNTTVRVAAAWMYGHVDTDYYADVRISIRDWGGSWPASGTVVVSNLVYHSIGLGFDDVRDVFLLTYVDTGFESHVVTINPSTTAVIHDTEITATDFASFLDPACNHVSGATYTCVIPVTSISTAGPNLGWVYGSVNASNEFTYGTNSINTSYWAYGFHDLARDTRSSGSVGYVGGYAKLTDEDGNEGRVYRLADTTPGTSPSSFSSIATEGWPLDMGSIAQSDSSIKLRGFYAR